MSDAPPRFAGADSALEPSHVSTGSLPTPERVQELVNEAHDRYRDDTSGTISHVYPALARVDPGLFGVCAIGVGGNVFAAGDFEVEFALMSVAKPFTFALACDALGPTRCGAASAWTAPGCRSTRSWPSSAAATAGRTRW